MKLVWSVFNSHVACCVLFEHHSTDWNLICILFLYTVKASPNSENNDGIWKAVWNNGHERGNDEWCHRWCNGWWRGWRRIVSFLHLCSYCLVKCEIQKVKYCLKEWILNSMKKVKGCYSRKCLITFLHIIIGEKAENLSTFIPEMLLLTKCWMS